MKSETEERSSVLQDALHYNITEAGILCYQQGRHFTPDGDQLYCNVTFDLVTCWPATLAGSEASMPCPMADYSDHTQNATYYCQSNGTWADKVNYAPCVPLGIESLLPASTSVDETPVRIIYLVGFAVSTLALVLALVIFLYFRSLRCLRNIIHCHLIVSFALKNTLYILIHGIIEHVHRTEYEWLCKVNVTAMNYLQCTNFFWMFVEGLYLFSMVVWAFSASKARHWHYVILGWAVPVVITVTWAAVKALYDDKLCWLPSRETSYDYIMHTPVIIVLACNVFFLTTIIWVLVTKLRASNSLETQQYRKAVRAILVLFPLLGLTYLLMFYGPSTDTEMYRIFKYLNAIMQTLQGLLVAVFFCFLNGEVQTLLRKKLSSIQDSRGLFSTRNTTTKSSFVGPPSSSRSGSFHVLAMEGTCNGQDQSVAARGNKRTPYTQCSSASAFLQPDYHDEDDAANEEEEEAVRML